MNLVNRQGDTESLMHLGAVFLVLLTDLLKKFLQEKQTEVAPYNLKNMNNKIVKLYRLYISTLKVFLLVTGRSVSTNTADSRTTFEQLISTLNCITLSSHFFFLDSSFFNYLQKM